MMGGGSSPNLPYPPVPRFAMRSGIGSTPTRSKCTSRSRRIHSASNSRRADTRFTVERGEEYRPFVLRAEVGNEPVHLRLPLHRWISMARRSWFSGDTHVHRTLAELSNVVMAEDLNVAWPRPVAFAVPPEAIQRVTLDENITGSEQSRFSNPSEN